ncbi:daple-like protein isoform X1 [Varroa jacobsoni]|nr:daple-like protein isoform X1 [Varroa jacobsoni]
MEVMTPSKMSQKQCLRMLNTRLANNIERIGPLVAENQELTHMNDLLRVQLLQEKEDRKRQIDALKARLEKALQEKAMAETDLRTNEDHVTRLKKEMAAGRRLFEEFRKQEAILKSEVSSLCNSASLKDSQVAELQKTLSSEQARRAAAEDALKISTTKMNIAQNKLKHAIEELATEQNRLQGVEKKNEILQQEKVALAARINTNSEQNHHLSQELARLREEYDSLMNAHNMNIRKNFEQELGNYVPKTEYDRVSSLLETQKNEIERLRIASETAEVRQRDWEQQHNKLLQEWHQDKMLLHDCRKEIKTFKLLIDQMDLATPKELPPKLQGSIEGAGRNAAQYDRRINNSSNNLTNSRESKSASCLFM